MNCDIKYRTDRGTDTEEELDFILNYDIKYRLGRDLAVCRTCRQSDF